MWTLTTATKLNMLDPWKNRYDKPRECIKKQGYHYAIRGPSSQSYAFSSSQVWI